MRLIPLMLIAALPGCAAIAVVDTAVGVGTFAAGTAVKGTVAAGRLVTAPLRDDEDDD